MVELLYGSGLRVGELVGLDVDDIDMTRRTLRVLGKGGRERTVPFGVPAERALAAWMAEGRPALACATSPAAAFLGARGGRIDPRTVRAVVHRTAAEVDGVADIGPHGWRHTSATHVLEGGADLRAGLALGFPLLPRQDPQRVLEVHHGVVGERGAERGLVVRVTRRGRTGRPAVRQP